MQENKALSWYWGYALANTLANTFCYLAKLKPFVIKHLAICLCYQPLTLSVRKQGVYQQKGQYLVDNFFKIMQLTALDSLGSKRGQFSLKIFYSRLCIFPGICTQAVI